LAGAQKIGNARWSGRRAPLNARRQNATSNYLTRITHTEIGMSDHVYKTVELTGSSKTSIEDAVNQAIAKAAKSVRDMQWFQVIETRGHIVDGKVAHWQVSMKVGFTLED
jgi:hypothetical protein